MSLTEGTFLNYRLSWQKQEERLNRLWLTIINRLSQTINELSQQPEVLKKLLLEHFEGLGPRTVTAEDIHSIMNQHTQIMAESKVSRYVG